MNNEDLVELASKKGYNLEDHGDDSFSIGTMDDDEHFGVTFDWLAEHLTREEVLEFLQEN